jgi:hypothetical protein
MTTTVRARIAAAVVLAAVTGVAGGTIAHALPPACSVTTVNRVRHQSCRGTWHPPRHSGTQVSDLVANPPR